MVTKNAAAPRRSEEGKGGKGGGAGMCCSRSRARELKRIQKGKKKGEAASSSGPTAGGKGDRRAS